MDRPDKIPPQNLEAEAAILGAVMFDKEVIPQVLSTIKAHYFYADRHRQIYEVIHDIFESNQPVDIITLSEGLKRAQIYDAVGGANYLTELVNSVETSAHIDNHMRIVREKALLRSLVTNGSAIVQDALRPDVDLNDVLDRAEKTIFDISQDSLDTKSIPFKETVKRCIESIDQAYQSKGIVTGLSTGFDKFDEMTTGMHGSELIIVAGRPAMGKSAFATCICENIAIGQQKPVAVFSLEMSAENITQRLLCSHARVDAHNVRKGYLSQSDWPKLITAAGKLGESKIFIDDTPGISVFELRAKARRMKRQHDIQLIIIDYLQLMSSGSRVESRQQEISEISRKLKGLARELDVPVIAISQLSRAVESRQGNRPQMSDLRESGSIEQDADVVVLLFREEYYNQTEENTGRATAIISKQRNGPVGDVDLAFLKQFTRFENLSAREYEVEY